MSKLGLKRICPKCGKRYYDLKKNPPTCPGCKTPFDPENLLKARRGRAADKKIGRDAAEETLDDLPLAEVEAVEESLIEDAEELGGDSEVEDVVEVDTEEDR